MKGRYTQLVLVPIIISINGITNGIKHITCNRYCFLVKQEFCHDFRLVENIKQGILSLKWRI